MPKPALVLVLGLLCALPPTSSRRSKRSRGGGGAARRGGSGSGSGEAEAGADEFLGIAERLVGRMGADAVAQAQLEQLLGAPIDGGAPAAALLSQGTSSAARQDHLQAARLFAAVPSAAGATDEELAAAALGMVAAGESLAALSHLRQALRLRQPAATATALQRGLARGLVAAALGSAVQRASPVVGAADGGPELVELLERSLRAAPPDFTFGNWVAHVFSEVMGQPESSAPVIGALTHTVLNREESRPWTIEHLNMGMMVHDVRPARSLSVCLSLSLLRLSYSAQKWNPACAGAYVERKAVSQGRSLGGGSAGGGSCGCGGGEAAHRAA